MNAGQRRRMLRKHPKPGRMVAFRYNGRFIRGVVSESRRLCSENMVLVDHVYKGIDSWDVVHVRELHAVNSDGEIGKPIITKKGA